MTYPKIAVTIGGITSWAPDYSKPGVAEAVEREVDEAMWDADPPRGGLSLLIRLQEANRRAKRK